MTQLVIEEESKEGLIRKIQSLYETDFGDFKRKAILYCNNFSQSPAGQALKSRLRDLKQLILIEEIDPSKEPIENIDRLRQSLIHRLEKM